MDGRWGGTGKETNRPGGSEGPAGRARPSSTHVRRNGVPHSLTPRFGEKRPDRSFALDLRVKTQSPLPFLLRGRRDREIAARRLRLESSSSDSDLRPPPKVRAGSPSRAVPSESAIEIRQATRGCQVLLSSAQAAGLSASRESDEPLGAFHHASAGSSPPSTGRCRGSCPTRLPCRV
jgi:hypothetical protein